MAKNTKKKSRAAAARRAQRQTIARTTPFVPTAAPAAEGTLSAPRSRFTSTKTTAPTDWAYEYRYVISDLKRMAITTVAMFGLLLAMLVLANVLQFLPH